MRQTATRKFRCLGCRKKLDTCTDVDGDDQPKPGNLTVCISCGHLMVFGHDMWPRNPTKKEMAEIAGDKRLLMAMKIVGAWKAWKAEHEG